MRNKPYQTGGCESAPSWRKDLDIIPHKYKEALMQLSQSDRDDVVMAVKIELEHTFNVLANANKKPEQTEKAVFLTEIEAELKVTLAECSAHV
jgi:hypothetical protein